MSTAAQKAQYLQTLRDAMTELGHLAARGDGLVQTFIDRGYDAAASDPVVDADLASFGVVVYDLGTAINALQQLSALLKGQATTPSQAYRTSLNKWRQL
jgi:hypothetical protein